MSSYLLAAEPAALQTYQLAWRLSQAPYNLNSIGFELPGLALQALGSDDRTRGDTFSLNALTASK